jgi:hypothetical protein
VDRTWRQKLPTVILTKPTQPKETGNSAELTGKLDVILNKAAECHTENQDCRIKKEKKNE